MASERNEARRRRRRGPVAGAQFGEGPAVDFRLLMREREQMEALRLPLARLAITRARIARALTHAMIDHGVEQGLSEDQAIDRALAMVEEPDLSWIREGRMPPCLAGAL